MSTFLKSEILTERTKKKKKNKTKKTKKVFTLGEALFWYNVGPAKLSRAAALSLFLVA